MTWTKLDDRFHDHPKIRRVWRRDRTALGLHVLALNYSSAHDLDGKVMAEFVEDQLPDHDERTRAIQVPSSVTSGRRTATGGGFTTIPFTSPHGRT